MIKSSRSNHLTQSSNRPRRSAVGLVRSAQLSGARLLLIVEDIEDVEFWRSLLKTVAAGACSVKVETARIASNSGGKQAVLRIFRSLRAAGRLASSVVRTGGPEKIVVGFGLDKDLDDIERRMCRSHHVIYTDHYCHENHLFRNGSISRFVQSFPQTSALDASDFADPLVQAELSRLAGQMLDWIAFCLCVRRLRAADIGNFGAAFSLIHNRETLEIDAAKFEQMKRSLASRSSKPLSDIESNLSRIRARLDASRPSEIDRVFNGKWYFALVAFMLNQRLAKIPRVAAALKSDGSFESALRFALISTVDFSSSWADGFRLRLRTLVEML